MRTLVIGDIHGNYKGLMQALERSRFDYLEDRLISLGDIVDGHCQSYEVVEELLKIKNLITIKGNHDDWFNTWLQTGDNPSKWQQGQEATGISYAKHLLEPIGETKFFWEYSTATPLPILNVSHIPDNHKELFKKQLPYYLDNQERLFIHGGFNRHKKLEDQEEFIFWWDRDLWGQALSWKASKAIQLGEEDEQPYRPKFKMVEEFKEVYIGHTSTQFWGEDKPMQAANIWNLDTGGGWFGKISIMDVDTKEFWQSDSGKELYPEFKGR